MVDREKVVANVTGIVSDMQEEVDEWKDYSDSELSNGLTCDCDWWYKTLQTLKYALALLKAQEASMDTVPVVHGRWVKMTGMMPPEYHGHYECSECGWHMKGLRNSWTREEEFPYCPHCGAKMDGDA